MEVPRWLTRNIKWLDRDGLMYRDLDNPVRIAVAGHDRANGVDFRRGVVVAPCGDALALFERGKQPVRLAGSAPSLWLQCSGDRFIHVSPAESNSASAWEFTAKFDRTLSVWAPDGALSRLRIPSHRSKLILPPARSRREGCCMLVDDGVLVVYDEDLNQLLSVHVDNMIRCEFTMTESITCGTVWAGNIFHIIDSAGNRARLHSNRGDFIIHAVVNALHMLADQLFVRDDESPCRSFVACRRPDEAAAWEYETIFTHEAGMEVRDCRLLSTGYALVICHGTSVRARRSFRKVEAFLVCLSTHAKLLVSERGCIAMHVPELAELGAAEQADVEFAVRTIDELCDATAFGDDWLGLVRTVLVGFVLEDARLQQRRLAQ